MRCVTPPPPRKLVASIPTTNPLKAHLFIGTVAESVANEYHNRKSDSDADMMYFKSYKICSDLPKLRMAADPIALN